MEQSEKTLDMIVNLCKNRGYVFPGSEIYGGLANSWDYGPLGVIDFRTWYRISEIYVAVTRIAELV